MRAPSHMAFSLFWGGILASASVHQDIAFGLNPLTAQCATATIIGALAPDLDSRNSPISKALPFLSNPICRRFPHRTLLHSLLGLGLATGVVCGLLWLPVAFGLWASNAHLWLITQFFAWSYLSHLILDTANKQGVPYLYGVMKESLGFPSYEEDRIISGDRRWEFIITATSLVLFGCFIHVIRQGAAVAMANVVGKIPQLREVYRTAVNREVVLRFEGYWEADRSPISGKGLILKEQNGVFTLFFAGRIYFLGQDAGDIRLLDGQIAVLNRPPVVWPIPVPDRTIEDILADVDAGLSAIQTIQSSGQVLISGELHADRSLSVNRPYDEGCFAVTAKTVQMNFAQASDIRALGIRPVDTEPSATEIEVKITRLKAQDDSLVAVKKRTSGLYESHLLFEQIKALRNEVKTLEKERAKRDESGASDSTVRFTGRLSARLIPEL